MPERTERRRSRPSAHSNFHRPGHRSPTESSRTFADLGQIVAGPQLADGSALRLGLAHRPLRAPGPRRRWRDRGRDRLPARNPIWACFRPRKGGRNCCVGRPVRAVGHHRGRRAVGFCGGPARLPYTVCRGNPGAGGGDHDGAFPVQSLSGRLAC